MVLMWVWPVSSVRVCGTCLEKKIVPWPGLCTDLCTDTEYRKKSEPVSVSTEYRKPDSIEESVYTGYRKPTYWYGYQSVSFSTIILVNLAKCSHFVRNLVSKKLRTKRKFGGIPIYISIPTYVLPSGYRYRIPTKYQFRCRYLPNTGKCKFIGFGSPDTDRPIWFCTSIHNPGRHHLLQALPWSSTNVF